MSTATIRRLGLDDLESYRALRLRALAEHPEAFTSSVDEEAAKPAAALARRLSPDAGAPHNVVLGAFIDAALAGFVGLEVDPRMKVRHKGQVFGMYVAAEHSGRGLGGRLLAGVIAQAENASALTRLVLTVTADNNGARRLYERAGFTAFGLEPDAIVVGGKPYAKLHMTRALAPPARAS